MTTSRSSSEPPRGDGTFQRAETRQGPTTTSSQPADAPEIVAGGTYARGAWTYGVALLAVALAALPLWYWSPWQPADTPVTVFVPAMLLAAGVGGLGPGVLATVLCVALSAYLLAEPVNTVQVHSDADRIRLLSLSVSGVIISVVMELFYRDRAARRRVEFQLRDSEQTVRRQFEQLKAIYSTVPAGLAMLDAQLRYVSINEHLAAIHGHSPEEHIGRSLHEMLPEPLASLVADAIRRVITTGQPEPEFEFTGRVGGVTEDRHWTASYFPVRDESGRIWGVNTVVQDITDRKRAEQAILNSENRLALAVRGARGGIWDMRFNPDNPDAEPLEFYLSPEAKAIAGYKPDELQGGLWDWRALINPEDLTRLNEAAIAYRDGKTDHYEIEYRIRRRDGDIRWIRSTGRITRGPGGRPDRWTGIVQDVTQAKEAERRVLESRAMLETVLNGVPQGVFWKDLDLRIMGVNQVVAKACGFDSPEQMVGLTDLDFPYVTREQAESYQRMDREVMATGRAVFGIREQLTRPDGRVAWLETNKMPLRDADGRIIGVLGTWQDITERLRAEAQLQEAQERNERQLAKLRAVLNQMTEGVILADADGNIQAMNPVALRLHGFEDSGDTRRPFEQFARCFDVYDAETDEHIPVERWPVGRVLRGETLSAVEVRVRVRATGQEFIGSYGGTPVHDREGRVILYVVTMRDVTAHKRAEQAMRTAYEQRRLALEAAHLGTWDADPAARTVIFDERGQEILGLHATARLGFDSTLQLVHPDDRDRVRAAAAAALNPVDGDVYDVEHRIVRPDGSLRWVSARGEAHFRGEGANRRPVRFVGAIQDVTERKRDEERMQTLLAELSHRVKNTLATVQSIASRTLIDRPDPVSFAETFEGRLEALAVAHGLLTKSQWTGADLRSILEQTLEAYQRTDQNAIALHGEPVLLSPSAAVTFSMIFHELATNAAKYGALSADAGRLDVAWTQLNQDGEERLRIQWTESGGPCVSPPTRSGFGSNLIRRAIDYELSGFAILEFPSDGLHCALECPAARAVRKI